MTSSNSFEQVKPNIQLLTDEQIQEVHKYSINILENIGIKVESKTAIKIFAKSGSVRIENEVVYIQEELINHSIKSVQSSVDIFNKNGDLTFQLGRNQKRTFFGIGVTNTYFQDIETNQVETFKRHHMQLGSQLGDMLNNYEMISTLGVPSDIETEQLDLYTTFDMYTNTAKPLVLLISEGKQIKDIFELLITLHGDISAKPFIIPYFNPITPLIMNKSTTDKMIASLEFNLPIMYSNFSMYGGTSPITESGSLALLNAELLAGLVFSQLVKEGSAVILGSLPAAFHMTTMGSHYTPSSYLLNLACSEMMNYYKIPHCGTSGSGNGWGPDLIASGELWMNHLTSCLGKIGCAPFVGGNFDSMAFSPTTVVLSDYIIGKARKFSNGFILNEEKINLIDIKDVHHGGNYLTSAQTLESISELDITDSCWPSLNLDSWKEQKRPEAKKFLIDYTKELWEKAKIRVEKNKDMVREQEEIIRKISST
ncbi:MAG: trimethylamine methyltransferase family protein [Melioribacteraceae bacterium]|nr:trimethylamine methyltransferase family protein [Melioribacteraceae bacterium]